MKRLLIFLALMVCGPVICWAQSNFHVFPWFVDGAFPDGSYYRSELLVVNNSVTTSANCDFYGRLALFTLRNGTSFVGSLEQWSKFSFTIKATGYQILKTSGHGNFVGNFAVLDCGYSLVHAQVSYAYYNSDGVKLGEATIFSAPSMSVATLIVDQRERSRYGIAIANYSSNYATHRIIAKDIKGNLVGDIRRIGISANSSLATFIDAVLPLPPDFVGKILIVPGESRNYAIGLKFTGAVFTTLPIINCDFAITLCVNPEPLF